jgi:palmitoyltransferase ZDHHC2/15/20
VSSHASRKAFLSSVVVYMREAFRDLSNEIVAGVERTLLPGVYLYIYLIFNSVYTISSFLAGNITVLVLFILYQFLVILASFSYFRMALITNSTTLELFPEMGPGGGESASTESFHLNPFEVEKSLRMVKRSADICGLCKTYKPERAYHCTKCFRCHLLSVKHSDWFDLCICFANYKFYVVLLFHLLALSMLGLGCFVHGMISSLSPMTSIEIHSFAPFVVALILQALALAFVAVELRHVLRAVFSNHTPEEQRRGVPRSMYDMGNYENWKMVMGDKWYMWMIPTWTTKGDGISYVPASVEGKQSAPRAVEARQE